MPQTDEADEQPGAPPAEPQDESFSPDDDAQPTDLQSPEGELPLDGAPSDAEQPDEPPSVEIASSEESPEDVAELTQVAAEAESVTSSEEPQLEQVALQPPRQLSRRERDTLDRQYRRFAACGRCGYFVADCRNYLGEAALVDAMLDGEDGWLRLEGDETFRRLLMYAYGIQIDVGYEFFDGTCPECRRRFVYMERPDLPTRLKIQI